MPEILASPSRRRAITSRTDCRRSAIGFRLTYMVPALSEEQRAQRSDEAKEPSPPYLSGDWGGLRPYLESKGLTFTLSYTNDFLANVRGGIGPGAVGIGVFQPQRNAVFPDVPSFTEIGIPVANGSTFFLVLPPATPPDVVRYLHDAAKAAMDDAAFAAFAKTRVIEVDYRAGDKLRADLWKEYKAHTEILKRLGVLRK